VTVDRSTGRWRGVTALGFLGVAGGALFGNPGLLLAGMVSAGYAAYARGGSAPPVELRVERTLSDADPDPGDVVTVRTTVTNDADAALPDLRFVDGVPAGLSVVEGAARTYTALRAGGSTTFTYAVEAARGAHQWGDATAYARDASGAVEREAAVETPATTLTCVARLRASADAPLSAVTGRQAGTVTADRPGAGVEFHSVREYRPGDPLSRVDWNRFAETGDLSTVAFDAERMATVVLAVDCRRAAYADADGETAHAVEHAVDAARQLAASLLDDGNRVGALAVGPSVAHLRPGLGRSHRVRLREFLATAPPRAPPDERMYPRHLDEVRRLLDGDVQVVWLSPLVDEFAVSVPRTLVTDGHAVTVVSPDVTRAGTPGERLARAERSLRLTRLRRGGVPAVDWPPDEPLAAALTAAEATR
jgi:uncharacterized repeat protein (TIGR01451 family)